MNEPAADSVTLSTGHTVDLPLVTEASMYGAVFSVPRKAVEELLPAGIRPIRATPSGKAAVTFLSVEYHHISVDGIDLYNEFSVIFPAIHGSTTTVPYLSALYRATNGYVWYLPVTTEPAKALGVDVWGYPKEVATITHEDVGPMRRTTVTVDGERIITFEVKKPPSMHVQLDGYSYTVMDDELRYVPIDVDAELGGWPFSQNVSVKFGDHPRVKSLRGLNLGGLAISRISLEGEACFYSPETVSTT